MTFRWLIRRLGLGLILVGLILSGTLLVASTQQTFQVFPIYYEVPFICGSASGSGDLSAGKYYSLINIVNATDEDIQIEHTVVSAIPSSKTSSAVEILAGRIGGAFGLTCEAIASRLGFSSSTLITGTVLVGMKEVLDAPDLLVVSSTILETIGSTTLATVVQPMTTSRPLRASMQPQGFTAVHAYPVIHALPFICGTASGSGDLPRGDYFSSVNIVNATGKDIQIDHFVVSTIPALRTSSALETLSAVPEGSVGLTCENIASRLKFPSNTLIAGTVLAGVNEALDAPELFVATSTILGTISGRTVVVQPMTTAPLLGSSSS